VLSNGNDSQHGRFRAQDVPATGYKVYSMRHTQKAAPVSESQQSTSLESSYYKVQLDPATGAIRSIYDKQLQRELVDQDSPYRFGQYLYVTGGDKAPNTILQYSRVYPNAELQVHPSHDGKIVSVVRTPTGQLAHLESQSVNTPAIRTEIRVFDHEKKIEFVENIDKNEVVTKEAAYFAFPFAAKQPQFQYEIQNGVVDPAKDMYPGAGHEWFTVQHWVSEQQDGVSGTVMPLDAPLVMLGDINRGQWPEQFGQRPGTILSYVMNNYWDTNYRASQGGKFTFHYVVTSADSTKPGDLSRMGWEEITPLEADIVTTQDKAVSVSAANQSNGGVQPSGNPTTPSSPLSLDGKQQAFLEVQDPNVLLETWKPAEDGNGTVMRFLDFGGAERTVTVHIPNLSLDHVSQTDAVERGENALSITSDGRFHFNMHPHEIVTIRVVERNK
jgi:alpha-mannosidase